MSFVAVSDLHIISSEDPLYSSLLNLLRQAKSGDTVVLAGDVFDVFVGNKPLFLNRYRGFFDEVHAADARGVAIHYIEGNHDFLMRTAFRGTPGAVVHSHSFNIDIDGKRFFIAHGDDLDKSDYGYRALRLFFRSPVFRAFAASIPGEWVDKIGCAMGQHSRDQKPLLPANLPTDRIERLRKLYRNYAAEKIAEGFDFVILGHCHDLDEMSFQVSGRSGQYINVGYPRTHGSFLSWSPSDSRISREKLPS